MTSRESLIASMAKWEERNKASIVYINNSKLPKTITCREYQVLDLVATYGLGQKEIAMFLKISKHTARCHLNNLYRKLNVITDGSPAKSTALIPNLVLRGAVQYRASLSYKNTL